MTDKEDADVVEVDFVQEPEPSPDLIFQIRLSQLLRTYSYRQAEILRLAGYVHGRAAEFDDKKRHAVHLIEQQIAHADDDAVARLMGALDHAFEDAEADPAEGGMDAVQEAIAEVTTTLDEGEALAYLESVSRALSAPPSTGTLLSSLLVSLVGETEMLVNQLARACFELQPGALGSNKTFSYSEVSAYESIDDFRDHVVDEAVEDVLRGSLTDWIDFFVKRFDIPKITAAQKFEALETVQRRHCIVHNAGTVSPQYMQKLSAFKLDVSVNDDLPVTFDYLERAADSLFLIGYSLMWALSTKLLPDGEHREHMVDAFTNRTMYLLQERRFKLVADIAESAPLARIGEFEALALRVNGWLARKNLGQGSTVRVEVEAFDVTARSDLFLLAKLSLLEENQAAWLLAQQMIEQDKLTRTNVLTWPLLRGVREWGRKSAAAASADGKGSSGDNLD